MEKQVKDDEITIEKLSKKDKGMDLDKLNEQMKDMQED